MGLIIINMAININKRKLLWILSGAVDYVGVTDLYHGKRVAYIANAIREKFNNFPWSQNDVVTSSLLHDCGVSSTDIHEHLISEMEWRKVNDHCKRGEQLLLSQPDFQHLAKAIGKHHSRWIDIDVDNESLLGNLIFLADRIDVLAATSEQDILIEKSRIIQDIKSLSGTLFCPQLVEIFINLADKDIFWLNWSECQSGEFLKEWFDSEPERLIEYRSLKKLFSLFSSCVDGKSSFTYNHSIGVATLSKTIAQLSGIHEENLDKIEIAGLLHDLGKLKIPDVILEKPGKLNKDEISVIRHHSYDTFSILTKIDGLEEITKWASQHHEKLNGTGYPKAESAEAIPKESRILAIADIFQALAQERPYKKSLSFDYIINILYEMCDRDEIDRELVELVEKHPKECLEAANTTQDMVDYLVI